MAFEKVRTTSEDPMVGFSVADLKIVLADRVIEIELLKRGIALRDQKIAKLEKDNAFLKDTCDQLASEGEDENQEVGEAPPPGDA